MLKVVVLQNLAGEKNKKKPVGAFFCRQAFF
jgi:hypothetical protein